jgi:hypothetical protein
MLSVDIASFFCIDVKNLSREDIFSHVTDFLTIKDFDKVYEILGGNLRDWYNLIKKLVE